MTRHRREPEKRPGLQIALGALVALAVLAVAVLGYRQLTGDEQPTGSQAAEGTDCTDPVTVTVAVSPELLASVDATASELAGSDVRVDGRCVAVQVNEADSADVAAAVAAAAGVAVPGLTAGDPVDVPDAWIPDSSLWPQRLAQVDPALVPAEAPSIATSPVVVAMPEPVAASLGWPAATLGWTDLLQRITTGSGLRSGIVEPSRDAAALSGVAALATAASSVGGAGGQQATAAALRSLVVGRSAVLEDLLQSFPRTADPAALATGVSAAPLSEQTVNAYNATAPAVPLAAVYLEPAPAPLDYPFVVLPGTDPARAAAAEQLLAALTGPTYRDRLAADGLRAADGSTGIGFPITPGAPATAGQPGAPIDPAVLGRLLTTWGALTAPARTLAVLDVSGSMNETVPTAGDATRMQVLLEAARRGLALFDDTWSLGLWTFSTELDGPGTPDYRQVVPIGPLSTNRQAIQGGLAGIEATRLGDTGLHDTILAGYREMQAGWQAGMVNTLIVLTDGENDDDNGISQEQLLAEIAAIKDPERPVRVLLLAFGPDIAPEVLNPIAEATGGRVFAATDPAQIGDIFLQAITTR